jgi:hypothetical protein
LSSPAKQQGEGIQMATARKDYSENEHSILYSETSSGCPLCTNSILFRKIGSKKINKGYEVAHIYPLHPTPAQALALAGHPAPPDINSLENVIALCPSCHRKYDKDFQVSEMIKLRAIKDRFLAEAKARATIAEHTIQEQVYAILDRITALGSDELDIPPTRFDASTIDNKLRTDISPLQKLEIKTNAVTFYVRIRDHIRALEQNDQLAIRILQNQVNTYYLAMQREHPNNKDAVFNFVAQWISTRTQRSLLAAKVLTSFFVQNCEVFDAGS